MKFSYTAVWEDAARFIREHLTVLVALAGVFVFLPSLLLAYFLPQPAPQDAARLIALLIEYFEANWHWLLLESLVNMTGAIAVMLLFFGRGGGTVGAKIVGAFALLPFFFLTSLAASLVAGVGFILLIVPGLYLLGRLTPVGPVVVAEDRRNPVDAIRRSFEVTRGHGWAVLGLVVAVAAAGIVVTVVINNILGLVLVLAAGKDLGRLLALIVQSATGAALATVLTILYAAIYRALAGPESAVRGGGAGGDATVDAD